MKLLFDFFPVLLFFITYKIMGIYYATAAAIIASILQVAIHWLHHRRIDKMHMVTLAMISILGGATLFFHNPLFIMWKPTGVYWITGLVFLGSHLFSSKPLIQKMMEKNISLPKAIWFRLNISWAVFFFIMGSLNIYIAYTFTMDIWVNFKLFGGLGLIIIFVLIQSVYLSRHLIEDETKTVTQSEKG